VSPFNVIQELFNAQDHELMQAVAQVATDLPDCLNFGDLFQVLFSSSKYAMRYAQFQAGKHQFVVDL
jgi:hypothetical protein